MWSNNMAKAIVTIIMWLVLGFISFSAMADLFHTAPAGGDLVALVLGPLVIALIGMFIVWLGPELVEADTLKATSQTKETRQKQKRQSGANQLDKIALLMELMDEDEQADFKATLKREVLSDMGYKNHESYDGESLESLLDDVEQQKRLRG